MNFKMSLLLFFFIENNDFISSIKKKKLETTKNIEEARTTGALNLFAFFECFKLLSSFKHP